MALIQWDSSLSVNIGEIDRQHQQLVKMINDLNDAMRQGKGKEILGKILNGLIGYTGSHFKTEETYFDQFGYPDTDTHKKEHAAFVQKVADFKEKYNAGTLGLSLDLMDFLSNWLTRHIKSVDKKYSAFFIEKGLK